MRNGRKTAALLAAVLLLLSGCGSGRCGELRLQGIDQLEKGKYQEAVESFEQAMRAGKGRISKEQFDILKYRTEAEYMLGDYEAAGKTLDILTKADGEREEYQTLRERIAAKLLVRDAGTALNENRISDARRLMDEAAAAGMQEDRDLAFDEIVYLEKTAQWQAAYDAMQAFTEQYPSDSDTEREKRFLETRIAEWRENPFRDESAAETQAMGEISDSR